MARHPVANARLKLRDDELEGRVSEQASKRKERKKGGLRGGIGERGRRANPDI